MSRRAWGWARTVAGLAILAVLLWRVGDGPFLDGLRRIDPAAVIAALLITGATTLCAVWRWRVVAAGIGLDLPWRDALASYYRSQFLNSALPGGVVGDVHRGLRHGGGDPVHGLRAVGWERTAGQFVQAVLAVAVLLGLPSPVRSSMPLVVAVVVIAALVGAWLLRRYPAQGTSIAARIRRAAGSDVRAGLTNRRAWPAVTTASIAIVVGHLAIFLIAARTAGLTVSTVRLLPIGVLILLAMSVPLNVAGWGPREGVAAATFAAAGLGASAGLATATVYGVLALVATLPGALVLLAGTRPGEPAPVQELVGAGRG